jgi:hypothetical protein
MAITSSVNVGGVLSGDLSIQGTINEILQGDSISSSVNSALKDLYQPIAGAKQSLQYPSDLDDVHYIVFNVKRRVRDEGGVINQPTNKFDPTPVASIALPIPLNLRDDRSVNYTDTSLGFVGGAGAGQINTNNIGKDIAGLMESFGYKAAEDAYSSILNIIAPTDENGDITLDLFGAAVTGGSMYAASKMGILGGGLAFGVLTAQFMKGFGFAQGIAYNPRMAVLFDNVNFRTFNFNYKMIARNPAESQQIQEIVKVFQKHMLPSYVPNALAGSIFTYPDEFEIQFSDQLRGQLFEFMPCVLKSVSVSYNEDSGAAFFEGTNAPTSVSISLQFQETKILTKEYSDGPTKVATVNAKTPVPAMGAGMDSRVDANSYSGSDLTIY